MIKKKILACILFYILILFTFGCRKKVKYKIDDIKSVSIACNHMDFSHSYSFYLRNEEDGWKLDADFSTDTENNRIVYESYFVEYGDVKNLLNIIDNEDVIKKVYNYKKPIMNLTVLDETNYFISIEFKDKTSIFAPKICSQNLEDYFYELSKKYMKNK